MNGSWGKDSQWVIGEGLKVLSLVGEGGLSVTSVFSVAKSMVYGEISKGTANGGMSAQPGKWLREWGNDRETCIY